MFTAHSSTRSRGRAAGLLGPAERARSADLRAEPILRAAALCGLLAVALPGISSAQARGTMQVGARVVPAAAAWTGVTEAGLAARAVVYASTESPLIRRSGLVRTATEVRAVGNRREVLVTIQRPHN
jgi:hypothetical protein